MQNRGGSCPKKSSCIVKRVSEDSTENAGGTPAVSNEKPAWMDNLRAKGLPARAQAAIKKDMGILKKAGVVKPLMKVVKLTSLKRAVAAMPIKKARPTVNEKGPIFGEWTWLEIYSHMVEVLLG